MEARGAELRDLPDIPIVVRPLISTSLHALAIEVEPASWCFRVRHRGSWRTKTTPKISVFQNGNRQFGVAFRIPARTLYTCGKEVFADLARAEFQVKGRTLQTFSFVAHPEDELSFLTRVNDARAEGLRKLPALKKPVPTNEAEIIDFIEHLPRRRLRYA